MRPNVAVRAPCAVLSPRATVIIRNVLMHCGAKSVAIPLRRVTCAAMRVVWKWKQPYSVGLSSIPIVLIASVCADLFRVFGREPISYAHKSPLITHALLGHWNMSLRVADCLIPPHVRNPKHPLPRAGGRHQWPDSRIHQRLALMTSSTAIEHPRASAPFALPCSRNPSGVRWPRSSVRIPMHEFQLARS